MYSYTTSGVCAKQISFNIENGAVKNVYFHGGCPGNLIGVSQLIEGMKVEEAIEKLKGITCGGKQTSCPDQLSIALEESLKRLAG
ncbi:TIGR03905 family TSCPD domain-containing protein [Alkaliphilus transvaalensis]|uniref:TIGR03905 family TSCPD domain-containing protein n=1 Tax=Alkaliphilus transvaalensis TaxID=114628 RepID=UPI000479A5DD|nr:TIGR03905 family TSCPD domain-containing protein [Alkaliphilus transvaalensis]